MVNISPSRAKGLLIAAAVLFSTGGAAVKACSFGTWQVAGFRSGIAALAILVFLPRSRHGWSWRSWLVGAVYAATMILFVTANKLTTSANAIFLQDSAPLYILLLGPFLLKERIHRTDLVFMLTVAVGMALFFFSLPEPLVTAADPLTGNILAGISGLTWALTLMGLRWLGKGKESAAPAIVAGNVLAFAFCAPLMFPIEAGTMQDWALLGFLGVFQIGLAYVFITLGIPQVPALEASIILLLEPVLNPIWSWMVHGEDPGVLALIGGAIILGSTLAKTWWDGRNPVTRRYRQSAS